MTHTTAVVFAHMFVQAAETAAADTPKTELTVAEAIKFLSTDPADLSEEAKLEAERTDATWWTAVLVANFVVAAVVLLCGVKAPYGRYSQDKGWGFLLNGTVAWIVQVRASSSVRHIRLQCSFKLVQNSCTSRSRQGAASCTWQSEKDFVSDLPEECDRLIV